VDKPKEEQRRVLAPVKMNLVKDPPALAYLIVPDTVPMDTGESVQTSRVDWQKGTVDVLATAMMAPPESARGHETTSQLGKCTEWLASLLANGAVRPSKDVIAHGRQLGYSERTQERARAALGVQADGGPGTDRPWTLRLPETPAPPPVRQASLPGGDGGLPGGLENHAENPVRQQTAKRLGEGPLGGLERAPLATAPPTTSATPVPGPVADPPKPRAEWQRRLLADDPE
jgi:hypothetical protein